MIQIRRALISVSDKHGLLDFARALASGGVEILSTGGTASTLAAAGIPVKQVSDVTGFPEILDGRVKTLHPKIHGGLLGVNSNAQHQRQMQELGIQPIDMVVVNLYPFEQTIAREGVSLEEAIENIDIGGPAMLRSAAKNHRHRAVLSNPSQYASVAEELRAHGGCLSEETCYRLACEVFHATAAYDSAIARYLSQRAKHDTPARGLTLQASLDLPLRYGENPHQSASLYGEFTHHFEHLHGKELSYNNILDISAAAALIAEFQEPAVAIIKHTNPCGVSTAASLCEAYEQALATDPSSAFGGIVATNRALDAETAEHINKLFTEVIISPAFPEPVLEFLRKKKDRRLMVMHASFRDALKGPTMRSVPGGYLVQDADVKRAEDEERRVVSKRAPTADELAAMNFAWIVAKHVKSNAIVYASAHRTLGIGAGQMSRVDSSRIAVQKAAVAGLSLQGSVMASDAYFPFADGVIEAIKAGATAVIQPGGSIRDPEVIAAADDHGIAMVFTGTRHFRH
ncbi:MAG TPA: bifunctional phosphoribosylaminoimidazolecarboxamide formyltransferase/IMP cyclohydrolase [Bacteroidota bacterium]|nr:bifunctional phosphoribosylaminoimidazolecarboxamide formyltransferase/IMP cyclohydrolase [Bacteroidota bacterium]